MSFNNYLWPKKHLPYVILTPPYNHISAGVKALHMLCHALNEMGNGQRASLVFTEQPAKICSNLNTPIATARLDNFIAVYPDIVKGNPLDAPHVVRWLLGDPKQTKGSTQFPETDMIWGYSQKTAALGNSANVLCLPVSDPAVFHGPADDAAPRSGACYYAYKCEHYWNEPIKPEHQHAMRLEGTPKQMADILRRSEVCYVYENSSVIMEARMCGCPVELVYNPHFTEVHTEAEWSVTYDEIVSNFVMQLGKFVRETQPIL